MLIIPAIDIREGKCVRLFQGSPDKVHVYSENPLETAVLWEQNGALSLHVIDLDGAFEGVPKNFSLIETIISSVSIPVQVGGGIRSPVSVQNYIAAGAHHVILGSIASRNFGFVRELCETYPERITVSMDARNGKIAVDGWQREMPFEAVELAREFEASGVASFIYTDILRDGTLHGPNLEAICRFVESVSTPVYAAGGICSLDDIVNLAKLCDQGLEGVIVGKAAYTGDVNIREAQELALRITGKTYPSSRTPPSREIG